MRESPPGTAPVIAAARPVSFGWRGFCVPCYSAPDLGSRRSPLGAARVASLGGDHQIAAFSRQPRVTTRVMVIGAALFRTRASEADTLAIWFTDRRTA